MLFNNHEDSDWLRQSFLLPRGAIDSRDAIRRTFTEATRKFTDTTLGGNFAINCPPQFTRHADPKRHRRGQSRGMGRYYSEAIDDSQQLVNLRFGVPEYNSLYSFFTGFYSADMAAMARQGRSSGFFYGVGKLLGYVVGIPLAIPLLTHRVISFMMGTPRTKYYYLKPAMPLYWNAVNSIVNELAVNLGIIPGLVQSRYDDARNTELKEGIFDNSTLNDDQRKEFNKILPDVWKTNGGIDVYAIATRAHRLQRQWRDQVVEIMSNEKLSLEERNYEIQKLENDPLPSLPKPRSMNDYIKSYLETGPGYRDPPATDETGARTGQATASTRVDPTDAKVAAFINSTDELNKTGEQLAGVEKVGSFYPKEDEAARIKAMEYLRAEEQDGGQFISYRVDYTGATSESFSNTSKESDIASMFNSGSSTARNARFSMAEGAILPAMSDVVSAFSSVISGALDSVGLSGIAAAAGSAFVDIPKHWDSSTVQLPRADYTVKLRSPYGNDLSRLQALLVPLAGLLAGAMPLSTGQNSYTSPFLCECYCRGRNQIRLGMIESLTVSRGEGNLGWNKDSKPLGIDVTFSVVDLSSIMHLPLAQATGWHNVTKLAAELFAEDSSYRDYMSVLSSMSLASQIYQFPKLFRSINRIHASTDAFFSSSHFASWLGGTSVGRFWSAMMFGSERTL